MASVLTLNTFVIAAPSAVKHGDAAPPWAYCSAGTICSDDDKVKRQWGYCPPGDSDCGILYSGGGEKREVEGDCPTTCLIDPNLPACIACGFGHDKRDVEVEGHCPTTCLIDPSLPACIVCGFGGFGGRKRDVEEREAFYCSRQVDPGCNGPPNNYPWKREPLSSPCPLDDPDCRGLPIVSGFPFYCESQPDSIICKDIGVPKEKKREKRAICPQGEPDCSPFHTRVFPSPPYPTVSTVTIDPPRQPTPTFTLLPTPTYTIRVDPLTH